jgi:hypothetical protein
VWNVADGYVQLARRTDKDDDLQKPVVGKPPHDQPDNDLIAAPDNRAPLTKLGDPPAETKQVAPFQSTWSFAEAVTPSLTRVFAVRDDYAVCLISPGYHPLKRATAKTFSIAACSKPDSDGPDHEKVLVYYVVEDDNGDRRVAEYNIKANKAYILSTDLSSDASDATRLCAIYYAPPGETTEEPYIFFQKKDKIFEYRTQKNSSSQLTGITDLRSPTPLAICRFNKKVYLFWLSSTYHLMYSIRSAGEWTSGTTVPAPAGGHQPFKADTQSDLSVVADDDKGQITIYYKQVDSDNEVDAYVWKVAP